MFQCEQIRMLSDWSTKAKMRRRDVSCKSWKETSSGAWKCFTKLKGGIKFERKSVFCFQMLLNVLSLKAYLDPDLYIMDWFVYNESAKPLILIRSWSWVIRNAVLRIRDILARIRIRNTGTFTPFKSRKFLLFLLDVEGSGAGSWAEYVLVTHGSGSAPDLEL